MGLAAFLWPYGMVVRGVWLPSTSGDLPALRCSLSHLMAELAKLGRSWHRGGQIDVKAFRWCDCKRRFYTGRRCSLPGSIDHLYTTYILPIGWLYGIICYQTHLSKGTRVSLHCLTYRFLKFNGWTPEVLIIPLEFRRLRTGKLSMEILERWAPISCKWSYGAPYKWGYNSSYPYYNLGGGFKKIEFVSPLAEMIQFD